MAPKNIIVCCDGTWGSSNTSQRPTNIRILANSIAYGLDTNKAKAGELDKKPVVNPKNDAVVRYFDGVGIGGTQLDFWVDGALALDIRTKCIEVYQFIAEYADTDSIIWLFGFSRGAYTVRSVAGMINNFGIVKVQEEGTDQGESMYVKPGTPKLGKMEALYDEVYSMFRSRDPLYAPHQPYAVDFKERKSLNFGARPPIRFMGLFDTVRAAHIHIVVTFLCCRCLTFAYFIRVPLPLPYKYLGWSFRCADIEPRGKVSVSQLGLHEHQAVCIACLF
jgi:Uncharacterized alpha/beta hydrolase domain (DUF2235)